MNCVYVLNWWLWVNYKHVYELLVMRYVVWCYIDVACEHNYYFLLLNCEIIYIYIERERVFLLLWLVTLMSHLWAYKRIEPRANYVVCYLNKLSWANSNEPRGVISWWVQPRRAHAGLASHQTSRLHFPADAGNSVERHLWKQRACRPASPRNLV